MKKLRHCHPLYKQPVRSQYTQYGTHELFQIIYCKQKEIKVSWIEIVCTVKNYQARKRMCTIHIKQLPQRTNSHISSLSLTTFDEIHGEYSKNCNFSSTGRLLSKSFSSKYLTWWMQDEKLCSIYFQSLAINKNLNRSAQFVHDCNSNLDKNYYYVITVSCFNNVSILNDGDLNPNHRKLPKPHKKLTHNKYLPMQKQWDLIQ